MSIFFREILIISTPEDIPLYERLLGDGSKWVYPFNRKYSLLLKAWPRHLFRDKSLSVTIRFVQDNQSKSGYGVLRGLHFQRPPFAQSKLMRCIQGEVLDVAVDLRIGSPTYGKHTAAKLNDQNQHQLWIPQGFAHGFLVLSQTAVFAYKCDNYYAPEYDGGILWNDPFINISCGIPENDIQLSN